MLKHLEQAISNTVMPLFMTSIANEFNRQGHKLSGATVAGMQFKVEANANSIEGAISAPKSMIIQNLGIAANRIPYSGRTGSGGKSAYIEALIQYAMKRGMENPKAAAFAIAAKHKQEGMQTKASSRFSASGARKGFVKEAIKNTHKQASKIIFDAYKKDEIERLRRVIRGLTAA